MDRRFRQAAAWLTVSIAAACGTNQFSNRPDGSPQANEDGGARDGRIDDEASRDSGATSSDYGRAVLSDGPIGYYPLDETGGQVARDVSGHDRHGAIGGDPGFGETGAVLGRGTSMSFSGDDFIDFANEFELLNGTAFAVELWLKATPDDLYRRIMSKETYPTVHGFTFWSRKAASSAPIVAFQVSDSGEFLAASELNAEVTDLSQRFVHIVVQSTTGAELELYVDGVLVDQATGAMVSSSAAFRLGNSSVGGSSLHGSLDEVAIYDHGLAPDRIRAHHRIGVGGP